MARSMWPRLPAIHFDFANTGVVNAFACIYRDQYFIGVTKGAVASLALFFERMLSDRRILMQIGNSDGEMEHPPLTYPLAEALVQDNLANGPNHPTDSMRQDYCKWLTLSALDFLILHELGHIANGHVDRAVAKQLSPFIAEFGGEPLTPEEAIELHLMEIDADGFAASQGVCKTMNVVKNPPYAIPQLASYDGLLFSWLFAVFSFFRMFGDTPIASIDVYEKRHPPHRQRVAFFWNAVVAASENVAGIIAGQLAPVVWQAGSSTERAFHFLTGEPISPPERYSEAFEPTNQNKDYAKHLAKRWNEGMRQELSLYAYGPLMDFTVVDASATN